LYQSIPVKFEFRCPANSEKKTKNEIINR